MITHWGFFSLFLNIISLVAACICHPLSFHCEPLRKVWFHLLYSPHLLNSQQQQDAPLPFFSEAEQLPQSLLLVMAPASPQYLSGPPARLTQLDQSFCCSERPKLSTVLQVHPHKCYVKGKNQFPHPADFTVTHAAWYVLSLH